MLEIGEYQDRTKVLVRHLHRWDLGAWRCRIRCDRSRPYAARSPVRLWSAMLPLEMVRRNGGRFAFAAGAPELRLAPRASLGTRSEPCERSLPTVVCVADELIADRGATVKDLPPVAGASNESGGVENLEVLRDGAGCDVEPPGDLDGG